jgi:PleD family two-component response regulator
VRLPAPSSKQCLAKRTPAAKPNWPRWWPVSLSAGAACHVLVVADDRELRALVGKYLAEHGFRVTQAANGREMMKAIEVGRFDLVVLDLMMPGESGLVLCQKLREQNGPRSSC